MRLHLVLCAALALSTAACGSLAPTSLKFQPPSVASPAVGQSTTLSVLAIDDRGVPVAGATVKFALQGNPPGVTLSSTSEQTVKGTGIAQVTLVATGRVTSATVVATSGKASDTQTILFAGSTAGSSVGTGITFQCGPTSGASSGGIRALGVYDETRTMIAGIHVICSAHVADLNGEAIQGASVSFFTEAGLIDPSAVTKVDGNADTLYRTGFPLPVATDPTPFSWTPLRDARHTGDYLVPLWMHPYEWRRNPINDPVDPGFNEPQRADPIRPGFLNNPRDNLVTMIAITAGQEHFTDRNGNGVYDPGIDDFTDADDTTEPFVDANDNGVWDPGELYLDTNGNGVWDGKNGKWDGNTNIWTANHILWTGVPAAEDYGGAAPVVGLAAGTPSTFVVPHFGSISATYFLADPWWNTLARNAASDSCAHPIGSKAVTEDATTGALGIRITYPPVEVFNVVVLDAHDPQAIPPSPPNMPAVPWSIQPSCNFTQSPDEGAVFAIGLPTISGTVF